MLKKGLTKKVVAFVLAFVVVATMTEWPMIAKAGSSATVLEGTWTTDDDDTTVSAETVTVNEESVSVLQVEKNNLKESTTITNSATYTVEVSSATDFELQWGMVYRSQNSNCTARLNITLYDSDGNTLDAIEGDRVMLSREGAYSDWEELTTIATVPAETAKVTYKLVLSSGVADLQVKSITAEVADDIERKDKSAETGWTAQEVWYPEDETTDCVNQFRYFRIKVELDENATLQTNTDFYIQLQADDSLSLRTGTGENDRLSGAMYVNDQLVTSSARKEIVENGKTTYLYTLNTDKYSLVGKTEFYICIRVINVSANAGLILQAYGATGSDPNFIYSKVVETNKETTTVSKLGITGTLSDWTTYYELNELSETDAKWYTNDYKESESEYDWVAADERGLVPYGNLGDLPFAWRYSNAQGFYYTGSTDADTTVSANAGEKFTVTKTVKTRYFNDDIQAQLYLASDTACNVVATIPVTVEVEEGKAADADKSLYFTATIPDYVPSGTYSMRLLQARYYNGSAGDSVSNILATVTVTNNGTATVTSKVSSTSNGIRLQIDGENVSPVMYLMADRDSYYSYDTMSTFADTGVELYTNFGGRLDGDNDSDPIWTAADTINTDVLDRDIYQTLDLNPNAMIIVNINMDAPEWWKADADNADQLIVGTDGTTINEVSFASTTYRAEASLILEKIIDHLSTASYKHRICGIRLSGGNTSEWMHYTDSNGNVGDYSSAMLNLYNKTYGTTLTSLPDLSARKSGSFGALLAVSSQIDVIRYNKLLSKVITDSILAYAEAAKTAMTENNVSWIVGAYNGYMWQENSAGGIGKSHTTCEEILNSDYIDFISSPVNYNERVSGYGTNYMTLSESIAAHDKLYIAEQDNRTVYADYSVVAGRTDALGKTYTVEDTIAQLKRDMSTNLVKGTGMWFYDMFGGWYDNDTIEDTIEAVKDEYDESLALNTSTNSEVAVFVGSETYNYLANGSLDDSNNDSYKIMSQLYAAQRVELSKMGTSYDTYMIEDLCNSNVSTNWDQYKLSIILSPFELTDIEISAIQTKLQKNGNYVLWVYMPGVSNGCTDESTMSADNITAVTGITTKLYTPSGWDKLSSDITMSATITEEAFGVKGNTYGSMYEATNQAVVPYISDSNATPLATYANVDSWFSFIPEFSIAFSEQPAAAMKTITSGDVTYTSVYSAIPNVPADSLRALCTAAGVHIYSTDKNTVVETNESYISVYSQVAGTQTITLPAASKGMHLRVYDVFAGTEVAVSANNTIEVTLTADETKLYRLSEVEQVYVNAYFDSGLVENGNFAKTTTDSDGNEVPVGGSKGADATLSLDDLNTPEGLMTGVTLSVSEGVTSDSGNGTYMHTVDLEAGKLYVVQYYAKYEWATGGGHYFYVYDKDKNHGSPINETTAISSSTTDWTVVEQLLTPEETDTYILKWRISGYNSAYSAQITNVSVFEYPCLDSTHDGKLFSNPTFSDWGDELPVDYSVQGSVTVGQTTEYFDNGYFHSATITWDSAVESTTTVYGLYQTVTLEAGKQYKVSFEGCYTGSGTPYLQVFNPSGVRIAGDAGLSAIKGSWNEASVSITPTVTGEHKIMFRLASGADGDTYEITKVKLEVVGYDTMISDGLFEAATITDGVLNSDVWTYEESVEHVVEESEPTNLLNGIKSWNWSVNNSSKVEDPTNNIVTWSRTNTDGTDDNTNPSNIILQDIALEAGTTYRISFDYKVTGAFNETEFGGNSLVVWGNGESSYTSGYYASVHSTNDTTKHFEFVFTPSIALAAGSPFRIRTARAATNSTVYYEISNITLVVEPTSTNLYTNGNFGTHLGNVNAGYTVVSDGVYRSYIYKSLGSTFSWGDAAKVIDNLDHEVVTTEEHGNAFQVTLKQAVTNTDNLNNSISLEVGKTYNVSFWYKVTGGAKVDYRFDFRDGKDHTTTDYVHVPTKTETAGTDGWKQVTMQYTATTNNNVGVFGLLFSGSEGGVAQVADVKIKDADSQTIETVSPIFATATSVNGITMTNMWGNYLKTTSKQTCANATYLLTMKAAVDGTGSMALTCGNVQETVTLSASVTKYKYLVLSKVAQTFDFILSFTDENSDSTFTVGDVVMELNRGDFDEDGTLSADDFTTMRKSIVGSADETDSAYSDLTGDGATSARDLVRMMLYEKGLK